MAERFKEAKKTTAIAKLNDNPTSPRKMRLVADKLLRSAIANWEAKNPEDAKDLESGRVYVKTIMVGEGRTIKRVRPMPQGRAGRIRKRSNHVTVILDVKPAAEEAK